MICCWISNWHCCTVALSAQCEKYALHCLSADSARGEENGTSCPSLKVWIGTFSGVTFDDLYVRGQLLIAQRLFALFGTVNNWGGGCILMWAVLTFLSFQITSKSLARWNGSNNYIYIFYISLDQHARLNLKRSVCLSVFVHLFNRVFKRLYATVNVLFLCLILSILSLLLCCYQHQQHRLNFLHYSFVRVIPSIVAGLIQQLSAFPLYCV